MTNITLDNEVTPYVSKVLANYAGRKLTDKLCAEISAKVTEELSRVIVGVEVHPLRVIKDADGIEGFFFTARPKFVMTPLAAEPQ